MSKTSTAPADAGRDQVSGSVTHIPFGMPDLPGAPQKAERRDTMELWNRLKRTDPKATKPFSRSGGFKGTQIDPYWRYQMLTEAFGPCGQGWGYRTTQPIIAETLVFIGVEVWYIHPETGEKCWSGMQYGGDVLFRTRREGPPTPNDEALKMAVTDGIGKAASLLGLGADVYMGQFDDSKYREESEEIFAARKRNGPKAIAEFEEEISQEVRDEESVEGLAALMKSIVQRLKEIQKADEAAAKRIISLFSARKAEILKAQEASGPTIEGTVAPDAGPDAQAEAEQRRLEAERREQEEAAAAAERADRRAPAETKPEEPADPDDAPVVGEDGKPGYRPFPLDADSKADTLRWAKLVYRHDWPLARSERDFSDWWDLHKKIIEAWDQTTKLDVDKKGTVTETDRARLDARDLFEKFVSAYKTQKRKRASAELDAQEKKWAAEHDVAPGPDGKEIPFG